VLLLWSDVSTAYTWHYTICVHDGHAVRAEQCTRVVRDFAGFFLTVRVKIMVTTHSTIVNSALNSVFKLITTLHSHYIEVLIYVKDKGTALAYP
jgi:hypothetical protein